jgi:hypothetical protein
VIKLAFRGRRHTRLKFDPKDKRYFFTFEEKQMLYEAKKKAKKCINCIYNNAGYCDKNCGWCNNVNSDCSFRMLKSEALSPKQIRNGGNSKSKKSKGKSGSKKEIDYKNNKSQIGLNSKVVLHDLVENERMTVRLVNGSPDISKNNIFDITMDSLLGKKILHSKVGSVIEVNEFKYRVITITK